MRIFCAIIALFILVAPARAQEDAAEALRLILATEYAGYDVVFLEGNDQTTRLAEAIGARVLPYAEVVRCNERLCRLRGGVRGAVIVDDVSRTGDELRLILTHWRQGEHRAYETVEVHTLRIERGEWILMASEPLRES